MSLTAKTDHLLSILAAMGRPCVALSGGVDSAVVAAAAVRAVGPHAVAVTADSPSVARRDLNDARRIAEYVGIRHVIVRTQEFTDANYRKNDGTRCYFCKSELYSVIEKNLASIGADAICSGANLDDRGDYRPGLIAASEHGIRHPLQEAGFTKADVRALAREWQLPVAEKPASPCLSSRVAPGVMVTEERTARIEAAEDYLRRLGLNDCRVRLHAGELARIEVPIELLALVAARHDDLHTLFRELGFQFVTLDLGGLKSGSLNELVPLEVRSAVAQQLTGRPS